MELLEEAQYFEKMRELLDIKHDETMTKINEKVVDSIIFSFFLFILTHFYCH